MKDFRIFKLELKDFIIFLVGVIYIAAILQGIVTLNYQSLMVLILRLPLTNLLNILIDIILDHDCFIYLNLLIIVLIDNHS